MIEITSKMAETVDKAEMTGTEEQCDVKIAQADAKEAGQHAAEIRREERQANVEVGEPSSVRDLDSIEAVEKAVEDAIAEAQQEEKRARRQVDYYANKLADDRLWLVTEFLSSMTLEQFVALPYYSKELFCRMIVAREDQAEFEMYFPNAAIAAFQDMNGSPLRGGRSTEYWRSRNAKDGVDDGEKATLLRQKEFLRSKTLPFCEDKVWEMLVGKKMKKLCAESSQLSREIYYLKTLIPRKPVAKRP